jgi:hypothetical protein
MGEDHTRQTAPAPGTAGAMVKLNGSKNSTADNESKINHDGNRQLGRTVETLVRGGRVQQQKRVGMILTFGTPSMFVSIGCQLVEGRLLHGGMGAFERGIAQYLA